MKICVIGLGYVGLPLAIKFSKIFETIGFDISKERIEQLRKNIDKTNESSEEELKNSSVLFTSDSKKIKEADFVVIAVPTPVDSSKKPDLCFLESASKIVGENLKKNAIVVYESSVYPGATEEICIPILEKCSNLKCGQDFKVGYSPERIVPGDKEHTIDKITKLVSAIDEETIDKTAEVYNKIIDAGVYKVRNIKTAEAAKIIENVQRDMNIALMNELSLLFNELDIDTKEVLEASGTKWNFLKFYPGLVGGHCIPIDPYYLIHKAEKINCNLKIITASRDVNESMPEHVSKLVAKALTKAKKELKNSKVLLLGLTFKENVKDMRNSGAEKLIKELKKHNIGVIAHDPLVDNSEKEFGIKNISINEIKDIDCIVLVNSHNEFKNLTIDKLLKITKENPVLFDMKYFFNREEARKKGFTYKRL
tara:strand:- start:1529 stop:2797 length:1269 start_codon:yes stop_codon:yes gene_type:complete